MIYLLNIIFEMKTPEERTTELITFWLQKYGMKGCLRRMVKYRRLIHLKENAQNNNNEK